MIKKIALSIAMAISPLVASADWMKCTATESGDMDKTRIYLACKETHSSGANVFALPVGSTDFDRGRAARFFAITQTALVSGKPLGIYFDANKTNLNTPLNASINCTGPCRVVDSFNLYLN